MLNEPIVALQMSPGLGAAPAQEIKRIEIFCEVKNLGIKAKVGALAAGIDLEAVIEVITDEIEDATHVELKGKRYKIENADVISKLKSKVHLGVAK